MRYFSSIAASACGLLASFATAQTVVEIPAPTVPTSFIDMDVVGPAGPTTLAAINAGGVPSPAGIANLTLTPSSAANPGIYNTLPSCVRGLGLDYPGGTGLVLVDAPSGQFTSFNARIDLGGQSTQFGVGIGDWVSTMVLEFYSGPTLLTSFTSSSYSTCNRKVFQMSGGTFDRVDLRASTTGGNWVITELVVEPGCAGSYSIAGTGCNDAGGQPIAISVTGCPDLADVFGISVRSPGASASAVGILIMGTSNTNWLGIVLPLDLGLFGATGCSIYTSHELLLGPFAFVSGSFGISATIPSDPTLRLAPSYWQGYEVDAGINGLGLGTSNYLSVQIR
jgi:hypothetical protein